MPIWKCVSNRWRTGEKYTYQEDNRDVEEESDRCVGKQSEHADAVNVSHGHRGQLSEEQNAAVDDSASGSVVVEGDERVHLEIRTAEQALDHDQADSLKSDTGALEEEANHDELDLTHGGDNHTDDNEGHVSERLQVDGRYTESPGGDENSNRHSSLEHLDKGHTQVQVCLVTADQAHTEEDTDGDNGSQIDAPRHGHLLS